MERTRRPGLVSATASDRSMPTSSAHNALASALTPRELMLVDAIAERVVERLRGELVRGSLVDAATVADALGVSRDCVYAHAHELGGHRVGAGARGRLRFDLNRALLAWTSCSRSKESQATQTP